MLLRFWELEAEKRKLKRIVNLFVMAVLLLMMVGCDFFEFEFEDNHEYVDLGLPSGLLWAPCNVGANSPEEYGDYWDWLNARGRATDLGDGWDGWRLPTKEEWEELYQKSANIWTTQNGVSGRLFTASNGNSLFLPAAGSRFDGVLYDVGSIGDYWSNSKNEGDPFRAWEFVFNSDSCYVNYGLDRGYKSVRSVRSSRQK